MNAARTYLREIIGLGIDADGLARADAMQAEGLEALEELADFDAAEIKTLCQRCANHVELLWTRTTLPESFRTQVTTFHQFARGD